MSKRALVIVDIQNDYFPGGAWELSGMEAAADNAAKLLAGARAGGDLIIHIKHEFPTSDAPFFKPGSHGAQIHDKVKNHGDEAVVVKHEINAFQGTNLKELLDQNKTEELVICGAMSHMCVDAAARAAHDYGYKVNIVHDACACRDLDFNGVNVPASQVQAAYMAALGFAYATMHSTSEFLSLTKTAINA